MDNTAQILSLFSNNGVPPDMLAFLQSQNNQQPVDNTYSQAPTVPTGNIKARIQQDLGAAEPDQGGSIQDILSSRFNQNGPSYGDYAQSAISSLNGKYASPNDISQNNLAGQLKGISELTRAQFLSSGGAGNATLKAAQQLMANDPNLDFATAFSIAKSGVGQGNTVVNGQVQNVPGAPQAAGNLQYGKTSGDKRATLETAAPIANATESGKEQGKITTEAQANLPNVVSQAELANKVIDETISHPGLAANFGTSGMLPNRPGSEASDAAALLGQIRGGAFLTAYNQLRGGGQISNTEGAKAEDAYARMTRAQSVDSFKKAARDYQNIINRNLTNIRDTASGQVFNQRPTETVPATTSNVIDYTEYFK